jgi:purine-binding chemotaxis protein CheW
MVSTAGEAGDVGSRTATPAAEQGDLLLVTQIGGQAFALPAASVERILPMAAITPLPEAPRDVAGVLNVRGEVLAVVDARRRLGLAGGARRAPDPAEHLVLVSDEGRRGGEGEEAGGSRYLLWVDRAERVVEPAPGDWSGLPGDARGGREGRAPRHWGGKGARLASEVVRLDGEVVPVLSPGALAPEVGT